MLYIDNMKVLELYAHSDSLEKAIFLLLEYLKINHICVILGGFLLKLIPVTLRDFPYLEPVEWTFKKKGYRGKVRFRRDSQTYVFEIESPKKYRSLDDGKTFGSLEEAKKAAESKIDMFDTVFGRLLALK
jgi:hypothetical protein